MRSGRKGRLPQRGHGRPTRSLLVGQLLVGIVIICTLATGLTWAARGNWGFSGNAGADSPPALVVSSGTEAAPTNAASTARERIPAPPKTTAKSVFALDVTTGQPLFARNADTQRAPASLAKMANGLVVVRAISQGLIGIADPVTIDASDVVDAAVYSHMGLAAGDTVTVEQLLYGAFLPSGNDAGHALARYVGAKLPGGDPVSGGQPAAVFVEAMNQLAHSLGATNTHFTNPDGTDDPAQYSTAHDLAKIGAAVLQSPELRKIVNTRSIEVTSVGPEHRQYNLFNTNQLLASNGIDGIKTGTEDAAGACLAVSAHRTDGDRIIVVVLDSAPDNPDPGSDPLTWPRFADAVSVLRATGVVIP